MNHEEQLKDFQQVLDMIANASMDPVVVCDSNGCIISTNQEALELFGYKMWELIGKNVNILMPEKYGNKHDYYMERFKATQVKRIIGQQRDGLEAIKKCGTILKVNTKIQHIHHELYGSVFIGVLKDVGSICELNRVKEMVENIVPLGYEERIVSGGGIADMSRGTVFLLRITNFYEKVGDQSPKEIVRLLSNIYRVIDQICKQCKLERVFANGSMYMAACGLTKIRYDCAIRVVDAAMLIKENLDSQFPEFEYKICVCTGNIITAVMRGEKLSFNIFGPTVEYLHNMANDSNILSNEVNVCQNTFEESAYSIRYRNISDYTYRIAESRKTP